MAPLWLAGLGWLLFAPRARPYRSLGIIFVVAFVILAVQHSKPYYLGPAFPPLFAAGAVFVEGLSWRWVRGAAVALVLASGAIAAPFAIPVLPIDTFIAYQHALGQTPKASERQDLGPLPQFFADRFGWPEMVEAVARVYASLPPELRAKTGIFANDFGQGGAIDFYGPRYGLPKAIGGHMTYWYWGPREYTGESLIVLGDRQEVLEREFEDVRAVATVGHPYAMQQEHFTVFLCQRPRGWTTASIWPRLKHWD
jgi:hypothetical protein